jgi:hypothetical protein
VAFEAASRRLCVMVELTHQPGDSSAAPESARKRPFGIYVIAALQALNALASGLRAVGIVDTPQIGVIDETVSGSLATVVMIVGLVVAGGLLQLHRWAWVATMLFVGLNLAAELAFYFSGKDTNYTVLVISIAQVFYLNLSDVQAAFERRSERA